METKHAIPIISRRAIQKMIDKARETLAITGFSNSETMNLNGLIGTFESVAKGEIQIKDLEAAEVVEPPAMNLYQRFRQIPKSGG